VTRKNGQLALLAEAALRLETVPFEDAIGCNTAFANAIEQAGHARLERALGLGARITTSAQVLDSGRKLKVVFSGDTLKKLRKGEYHLPIDEKTKLVRIDARDAKGKIRELGKVKNHIGKARLAVNVVVSAAHLISAADVMAQLKIIDRKLDRLWNYQRALQLGKLRGAYEQLRQAIRRSDARVRHGELVECASKLLELECQFLETTRVNLENVRDPSDISVRKAIFSLQSTALETLQRELSIAYSDWRAKEFASTLRELIYTEIGDGERLAGLYQQRRDEIGQIRELMVEKIGYLDLGARDAMTSHLQLQARKGSESVDNVVFEIGDGTFVLHG